MLRVEAVLRAEFPALPVIPRLKTLKSTQEKLARREATLSKIHDIAGVRLLCGETRHRQDAIVARVLRLFPGAREIDRRQQPNHGYRAVHVIARVDGVRVEVQVRTRLQHIWAEVAEGVADAWGRQIRYGGEPNEPGRLLGKLTRRQLVTKLGEMAKAIAGFEEADQLMHSLPDRFPTARVNPKYWWSRLGFWRARRSMHQQAREWAQAMHELERV